MAGDNQSFGRSELSSGGEAGLQSSQPFGVVSVFSNTVRLFFKRFFLFVIPACLIMIGASILLYAVYGASLFLPPDETFASSWAIMAFMSSLVVNILVYGLLVAFLALAAYDAHRGHPARLSAYLGTALRHAPIVLLVTFISGFAVGFGLVLLIVPGVFLLVVWSVAIPSIVLERTGFGALGRSRSLTKNYRWQVLGFLALVLISTAIVSTVLSSALGFGLAAAYDTPSALELLLFQAAVGSVTTAFYSVAQVTLFARLKELKEGIGMDDLAAIFD